MRVADPANWRRMARDQFRKPGSCLLSRERARPARLVDRTRLEGSPEFRLLVWRLHSLWSMADQARSGPPVAEHDDILTTEEAARLLKVSERTLERWRVRRRIPYVEYPRQGAWAPIRFRRADILEWLRQRVVKVNRSGDQVA